MLHALHVAPYKNDPETYEKLKAVIIELYWYCGDDFLIDIQVPENGCSAFTAIRITGLISHRRIS
jgi:hypothetical protein